MLYLKDQVFDNLVVYELNRWSTEYGSNRAPHEQMLGGRLWDACQKYQIKNMLALWVYGASRTSWFSTVARDREGQIAWSEKIAEEYSRVGDIRLMSDLTLADIKTMELVWGQAAARLDAYAANKKPSPKLPDPKQQPIEVPKKKEEPEQGEEKTPEPKPTDKESPGKVEEPKKSGTLRIVGVIAGMLAAIVAWLPIPAALASILKVIFNAIASVFR
jgi:hypothetical protein